MLLSMKTAEALTRDTATRTASPCVEIVVPVYNEEASLADSVRRLRSYLDRSFPFTSVVTVVDNGSTDATSIVAADLACELDGVRAVRLTGKGRGRALRAIWSTSTAQVVAYMDVDLSTSLDALLPLVAPLLSGHSDVAIGTRLAPGARVVRGPKRELISRVYNLVLKIVLRNGFSDAQCGFKAARTDVAKRLLPHVEDNEWFFDTEFLVLAERSGFRIHEVPVDWVDDPDSRVDIIRTAGDDLRGLARLCLGGGPDAIDELPSDLPASVASFARIGVVSTARLPRPLLLAGRHPGAVRRRCAGARRLHGGQHRRSRSLHVRPTGQALTPQSLPRAVAVFSTSVTVTFLALGLVDGVGVTSWWLVAGILVLANAAAALVRFVVLRGWMFRTAQTNPRRRAWPGPRRRVPSTLHERQTG